MSKIRLLRSVSAIREPFSAFFYHKLFRIASFALSTAEVSKEAR